ncbi:MAG: transposase [Pseudomonadota bacterium]
MPNYRRYHLAAPVFVTLVARRRQPWLVGHAVQLSASMHRTHSRHPFRHLAHAVMPDHMHWLFEPGDGNFSAIVAAFKRDVTWALKSAGLSAPLWQDRFYDHIIRDDTDLHRHLDYIHFNPVKHGHCMRPCDWPHSSFAAWQARGAYSPDWGAIEPDSIAGMELECVGCRCGGKVFPPYLNGRVGRQYFADMLRHPQPLRRESVPRKGEAMVVSRVGRQHFADVPAEAATTRLSRPAREAVADGDVQAASAGSLASLRA